MTEPLPPGWVEARLGDLGTEVRGQIQPEADVTYDLYSVPAFPSRAPEHAVGASIKSGKRAVRSSDVLLCKINPRINRVWVVGEQQGRTQIASTEYLVLRPHDLRLAQYLCRFLSSPRFREWIKLSVEGATGSHTRAKSGPILRQMVPLPPLAEQHRVVGLIDEANERLDAADDAVAEARARIEAARRSILSEAFAGRLVPQDPEDEPAFALLERIGADPAPNGTGDELPPGWAAIRLANLSSPRKGKVVPEEGDRRPYLNLDNIESDSGRILGWERSGDYCSQSVEFFPGDVTYARLRPYLNKVAIPHQAALGSAELIVLPPSEAIESRFLQYVLLSSMFVQFAQGHSTGDRPRLKWQEMRNFRFALPPLEEQRRIVAKIEEAFGRLDVASEALVAVERRIEAVRRSILSEAFAGRLVPQDPDDEPASALLERIAEAAA